MKFNLEENIDLYQEISNIYEDSVIRDLKAAEIDLKEIFEQIFEQEADDFGLVTNSSITSIPYFSIKSRVKKVKSFTEKLVRKDIGITLLKEFGMKKENILANKAQLINKLKKLDDIVGLRIVTELREDTLNAYKLLVEKTSLFESKKVIFYDIKHQPQVMKNGLSIYRIKGEYDGLVCFELQIKSKIDEAWGEMDHTIFYKDHSSSLIKPTIQKTMNNVGIILEKLETLLYDLRHSSQVFEANSSYIEFENNLYKKYNVAIATIFKHPVPLADISKVVYSLKSSEEFDGEINFEINFEFVEFEIDDPFYSKLLELFHSSHNLIIVEALFYCILKSKDEDQSISQVNYKELFERFYNYYQRYANSQIDKDGEFVCDDFQKIIKNNIKYIQNNSIITDLKKIEIFKKIDTLIKNSLEDSDEEIKVINSLFFLAYFSSDFESYYIDTKDNIAFNLQEAIDIVEKDSMNYDKDIKEIVIDLSQSLKKITK